MRKTTSREDDEMRKSSEKRFDEVRYHVDRYHDLDGRCCAPVDNSCPAPGAVPRPSREEART